MRAHTRESLKAKWPHWTAVDGNGCWIWQRSKADGYGQLGAVVLTGVHSQPVRAHVAAYLLFVGRIPDGHVIHHVCETKACANPAHLLAVTELAHKRLHTPERCPRAHEPNWHLRNGRWRQCRTCDMEAKRVLRGSPLAVAA